MIPPSDRIRLGDVEIVRLLDGTFRVDGGAMFGVVPRTLWARMAAPDAENRITLALNCYLVRTPEAVVLLDTGVGPDVDRRRADFYSFERRPGFSRSSRRSVSARTTSTSSSTVTSISITAAATP